MTFTFTIEKDIKNGLHIKTYQTRNGRPVIVAKGYDQCINFLNYRDPNNETGLLNILEKENKA